MTWFCRITGAYLATVNTEDPASKEYGAYARAAWMAMPGRRKQCLLQDSHRRLASRAKDLASQGLRKAAVFGTGPSIELAVASKLDDCIRIACNSVVQSDELMSIISPHFLTAGDVVSHFGVSAYAERFRHDLASRLREGDRLFLTTAEFGFLLVAHNPSLVDKVVLIEQRNLEMTTDLLDNFSLPLLDSTLNIHMLPLATTLADEIYLFGCDGQSPSLQSNEDFWAHSQGAQYHDLVESGHRCHPTFDQNRRQHTLDRYFESTSQSIHKICSCGKFVASVGPSFTPPMARNLLESAPTETGLPRLARCRASHYKVSDGGSDTHFEYSSLHDEQVSIHLNTGHAIIVTSQRPVQAGEQVMVVLHTSVRTGELGVCLIGDDGVRISNESTVVQSDDGPKVSTLFHRPETACPTVMVEFTCQSKQSVQAVIHCVLIVTSAKTAESIALPLEPFGVSGGLDSNHHSWLDGPYPPTPQLILLRPNENWVSRSSMPISKGAQFIARIYATAPSEAAIMFALERHGPSPIEGTSEVCRLTTGVDRIVLQAMFQHEHAEIRLRVKNMSNCDATLTLLACCVMRPPMDHARHLSE